MVLSAEASAGAAGAITLNGSPVSASITTGPTITLPSWTPDPNDAILVAVAQRDESTALSVSGHGLTWTEVANVDNVQGQGGVSLWQAQGAVPATGSITVTISGNTLPVAVIAQRFAGVDTTTPVEALSTHQGPAADNRDMLHSVTTQSPDAWTVAVGWHRGATLTVPADETAILLNQVAGSSGAITRSSMWFEGPVGAPGSVQLGAANDLSGANDWAVAVVSLRPASSGPTAPVADFTAVPGGGAAPLMVAFTSTSTGSPAPTLSWDFGDPSSGAENTSAAVAPSHTFTAPGTYTVTLTASNPSGTSVKSVLIEVTPEPPPPTGGPIAVSGAPVGAGVVSGATLVLPAWAPGPGEVVLLSVAQRDESKAVSVSGNGLTWTEIANVDNVQGQGGISFWRAQGASPTAGSITVAITGNTRPVTVIAQRFSGVDTTSPVEALATNKGPAVDDRNMLHSVTTLTPDAWAVATGWYRTATFALPAGETAVLLNQVAGTSAAITRSSMWFEGPVGVPGSVQLGAANDLSGANDWALAVVSLRPASSGPTAPVADFTAVPGGGAVPLTVAFTSTSTGSPAPTLSWDFGDPSSGADNTSAAVAPSHTFAAPGTYTVTLTASNPSGTSVKSVLIEVTEQPPPPTGALSFSGNEITDSLRLAGTQGDGRPPDSSYGIWEATTNLDDNGGFENGSTAGWIQNGGVFATSTEQAKFGIRSGKETTSATGDGISKTVAGLSASTTYTRSLWVYRTETAAVLSVAVLNGASSLAAATVPLQLGWHRLALTFKTQSGQTSVTTSVSASGGSVTYYVDGAQLEKKVIATPYVETSGSSASRGPAKVSVVENVVGPVQGWVAVRIRLGFDSTTPFSPDPGIVDMSLSNPDSLFCYYNVSDDTFHLERHSGGTGTYASSAPQTFAAGDVNTLIFAWTATQVKISVDGGAFTAAANTTIPGQATLYIGSNLVQGNGSNRQANSDFLWVAAGSGPLTDADAATIHGFGNADHPQGDYPGSPTFFWSAD